MPELTSEEKDLLYRLEIKPELVPHFFRRVKGLKWLDELINQGYFQAEKLPKPILDAEKKSINIPPWSALQYLLVIGDELKKEEHNNAANKVLGILREVTQYAADNDFGNYRVWWQFSKIIRCIPFNLLISKDLEMIKTWLGDQYERALVAEEVGENWLPEILNCHNPEAKHFSLGLLDLLFTVEFSEKKFGNYETKEASLGFDSYHTEKLINVVAKLAGAILGIEAVAIFEKKLRLVLKTLDKDTWSSSWRPAIEKHNQNNDDNAEDILVVALRESLLGACESNSEGLKARLDQWLGQDSETFKRIAIFIINKYFDLFSSLLPRVLIHENFAALMIHELWHLLNIHFMGFEKGTKELVLNLIDGVVSKNETGEKDESATAYKKASWLSSIKDTNRQALEQYSECIALSGFEPDHPDFSTYTSSGWVGHKSPIEIEKLQSLKINQLVSTLSEFKESGHFGEPGLEGLAKTFKDVVKSNPYEISLELMQFSHLDLAYIYEVFEAYHDLWNEKATLNWFKICPKIIKFSESIIRVKAFWAENASKERHSFVANRHWIVGSISSFIEDGVKNDAHAFDRNLLPQAKTILLFLLERQKGEDLSGGGDAVIWAINSPRGKCLEALINLALRQCRLSDGECDSHDIVWNDFQLVFEKELDTSLEGNYEFRVLVTLFLPNFLYMSRNWILENLGKIFNQSSSSQWSCAIQGYSYLESVDQDIYTHLKENGDYLKALDEPSLDKKVREKVIKDIAISYINGGESFDSSHNLINALIERNRYEELNQLIWFLWVLRDKSHPNLSRKIFELWPRLLSKIDFSIQEGRKLADSLCLWVAFIETISDKNKPWFMACAPFVSEKHCGYDLMKNLRRLSHKQPFEVQEIWLKVLDSYSDSYPEGEIKVIFKNLVSKGSEGVRRAKSVADAYLLRGNDAPGNLLREIIKIQKT